MKNQDGHSVKIIKGRDRAIELLVQNKHQVILEWPEPWPGLDDKRIVTSATVLIRSTVQNCIDMQRYNATYHTRARKPVTDVQLLDEFMLQNCAYVVDAGDMQDTTDLPFLPDGINPPWK